MRGLGLAAMLVFINCASQPKSRPTVNDQPVRSSPPALEAPPLEAPPPEAPPSGSSAPATSAPPPSDPPPVAEPGPTAQCSARGGTIQAVCMLGQLFCVVPYRDGGKRCSDKRDCIGECLYEGRDPAPPNATGSCQRTNDPCGCKAPIHHGRVEPAVCLD